MNKTVRTIKSIPLSMRFWPLRGKTRIVGYPDASYRNNEDKSSHLKLKTIDDLAYLLARALVLKVVLEGG